MAEGEEGRIMIRHPNPRDWTEDFAHENGNYLCRCVGCHETFTGHKRRVVCRVCHDRNDAEAKRRAEWLFDHDAPTNWVILTAEEVGQMGQGYSDLLLRYHVEQKTRQQLADALQELAADHYTNPSNQPDRITKALKASAALDKS